MDQTEETLAALGQTTLSLAAIGQIAQFVQNIGLTEQTLDLTVAQSIDQTEQTL